MAVHMDIRLVLLVVMLFGSLTAKPVEDPAPSRYYYGGESNDYFDVGKYVEIKRGKECRDSSSRCSNFKMCKFIHSRKYSFIRIRCQKTCGVCS